MKLSRTLFVVLVTLGFASSASMKVAMGQTVPKFLLACAPCHGFDGVALDRNIPNLAGQQKNYLYAQLLAFRAEERKHPLMNFFSRQMDVDELEQLADYYATLMKD